MAKEILYTPKEAAAIVGLSYEHFRKCSKYMKLALVVLSANPPHGNRYLFTQGAVDEIKAIRAPRPQVDSENT